MAARGRDAVLIALLVIGVIAVAILALAYLDWLLAAMIVLIAVIALVVVAAVIIGGLAAIPYYFTKRGKDSTPGSYKLEEVDDMRPKEQK
jgi:hypothetical protein